MSDWLTWVLGSLCGLLFVAKLLTLVWLSLYLRRHWPTTPELYGLDWADVVFRIEREFKIVLTGADFEGMSPEARDQLTAAQLWDVVAARMETSGLPVPEDGWSRLVKQLCDALNVRSRRVTPTARLYADLGMAYGLD